MVETKMNKTRHAHVGSTHPSGWNVKIKLLLKASFFFKQLWTFTFKSFWRRFDPKSSYKTVNKNLKKSVDSGGFPQTENCHASHSGQGQRTLTPYQSSLAFQNKTKTANSLPNHIIHRARLTASHLRTTYTHSPPGLYLVEERSQSRTTLTRSPPEPYLMEEKSQYIFWHNNFYLCKIKKNQIHSPRPFCPVDWGCRIHRLLLCRGVRSLPQWVSWIWHWTII